MAAVKRTATIPAPADRVWEALEHGAWLGDEADLDTRVGGEGYVLDRGELRHVVVESVTPGTQLVYRWWPLSPDGVGQASRVTIDLEPDQEATRVVIVEAPLSVAAPLPPSGPVALARC